MEKDIESKPEMETSEIHMEYPSKSLTSRLGLCEVCQKTEAKYTCPKCEVKTCSLPCLNIHKKELECDGIRDRTRYIPIKKMTTMDYMSDYNFLEECTRFVHARRRPNIKNFHGDLPKYLHRLRVIARQRRIHLQFLGQNFTRRKMNSTFFDGKHQKIFWCVEWVFVNAENRKFLERRCCEKEPLGNLLSKYIGTEVTDPDKEFLEHYRSRGFGGIKVLMKTERIQNCWKRFYEMDLKKSLEENLRKKNIIEFPTFLVIFRELETEFDIIDSDEDEKKPMKEKEMENSPEKDSKPEPDHVGRTNFLFTDESLWNNLSSDEDDGQQKI